MMVEEGLALPIQAAAMASPERGLFEGFAGLGQGGQLLLIAMFIVVVSTPLLLMWVRRRERRKSIDDSAAFSVPVGAAASAELSYKARQDLPANEPFLTEIPPAPVPEGLVDAIAHGSAVLVVGSTPLVRENVPTWTEFLRELSRKAIVEGAHSPTSVKSASAAQSDAAMERLLVRGEGDAVVDLVERMIGRDELASQAREAFANAVPSDGMVRLCKLGWSGFVSTGIDDSMRRATGATHILTPRSSADFEQFVRVPDRFLLQLSGDLTQPGTLILTQAQLKEAVASAPDLRSLLVSFLSSRTVLFVAMPFEEIEFLLDAIGIYGQTSRTHYALVENDPDFELIAERAGSRYQIELLEIGGREGLTDFSIRLTSEVDERERTLSVAPVETAARGNFISQVKLTNIGPFSKASVKLGPGWTVILGNNGAGKSTLLRAIALILAGTDQQALPFARSLLRRHQKSGTIEVTINTVPQPSTYKAQLLLEGDRVNLKAAPSPLQAGSIAAFGFSAVRGVNLAWAMEPQSITPQPLPRVSDILPLLQSGVDTRAQDLRAWIRQNNAILLDPALVEDVRKRAQSRIDKFFKIVDDMAPGFELSFSRCDSLTGEILLNTSDGEIPMDYVSQGMSSMIGWVGTLIQRLFEIHPDLDDPIGTQGIILIDEIDSHLHPEWQQRLVPTLRKYFPNLQVIATTHSPLMVGSLEAEEVVKVERDERGLRIERLDKSYKGYRFDQILTDDAFNLASARDQDWEALRREYAELLGKSKRNEADEKRYLELDAIMDRAPPPFESKPDRDAYEASRDRVDEAIIQGTSDGGDAPSMSA